MWGRASTPTGFLLADGFHLVAEGPHEIRYESMSGVFVRVFHATDDHYLGFRVGLIAEPRNALTQTEMLAIAGAPTLRGSFPDPLPPPGEALIELARRLREYGAEALAGERSVFDTARDLRRTYTAQFTRKRGVGDATCAIRVVPKPRARGSRRSSLSRPPAPGVIGRA